MIRPKSVKVLGKTYKIIYSKEKWTDPSIKDEMVGMYNPYPKSIKMWTQLEPDEFLDILIHEVIHAIDAELDVNLKEKQVKALGVGLADFLITNRMVKI